MIKQTSQQTNGPSRYDRALVIEIVNIFALRNLILYNAYSKAEILFTISCILHSILKMTLEANCGQLWDDFLGNLLWDLLSKESTSFRVEVVSMYVHKFLLLWITIELHNCGHAKNKGTIIPLRSSSQLLSRSEDWGKGCDGQRGRRFTNFITYFNCAPWNSLMVGMLE